MKNIYSLLTKGITCLTAMMLFLFLTPQQAGAQQQNISGSGTPNFERVKDSRIKPHQKPARFSPEKNKNTYQHFADLGKTKKIKGKPHAAKDSSGVYAELWLAPIWNYCDTSAVYLHTNTDLLFYAGAETSYLIDSLNVSFTIDYGDGMQQTLNPHSFSDSIGVYSQFYGLFFHSYTTAGNYTPTLKVVTSLGDSTTVYLYYDSTLTIHNGPVPQSSITDLMMYSDQYCNGTNLIYSGSYPYISINPASIQSENDLFTFYINFGDGSDTSITLPFLDIFMNYGYWYYYNFYMPMIAHTYTSPGTYNVQTIVTFPDAVQDTAYAEAHIADECNEVSGTVFVDNNNNCIKDPGELAVPNVYLSTSYYYQDTSYYYDCNYYNNWAMTDTSGFYAFYIPNSCQYTDTIFFYEYWNFYGMLYLPITCPTAGYYTFDTDTTSFNNNFALGCSSGYDLTGEMWGWRFRPGFQGYIYPSFGNGSCDSINGTASLVINNPGYLTIDSVSPTPLSIAGNSVTWSFTNLSIFDWYNNAVVYVSLDPSATLGDTITAILTLYPISGDNDPSNNVITSHFIVSNSWDPNEKVVFPHTDTPQGIISPNQELTYVLHFQNTGTDTAYNISVMDTLDTDLDLAAFHVLTASHYMTYTLTGNVVTFNFQQIMLPDSFVNAAASQGFVTYSIKPRYGLAEGTKIKNTGYIYFDYNPAVVTNTTLNTISYDTKVDEISSANGIKIFPNPAIDEIIVELASGEMDGSISIYNIQSQLLLKQTVKKSRSAFDISSLCKGIYFVKYTGKKKTAVSKFVKE